MLDSLGLPLDRDFTTFQWLGNTGSAALPVTLAIGIEQQAINESENIAMLGIGSGINCLMIAAQLSSVAVGTNTPAADIMSQMS
jgi:3-oxoacyl-[acyl-carrier-protein] synthase-3